MLVKRSMNKRTSSEEEERFEESMIEEVKEGELIMGESDSDDQIAELTSGREGDYFFKIKGDETSSSGEKSSKRAKEEKEERRDRREFNERR